LPRIYPEPESTKFQQKALECQFAVGSTNNHGDENNYHKILLCSRYNSEKGISVQKLPDTPETPLPPDRSQVKADVN